MLAYPFLWGNKANIPIHTYNKKCRSNGSIIPEWRFQVNYGFIIISNDNRFILAINRLNNSNSD